MNGTFKGCMNTPNFGCPTTNCCVGQEGYWHAHEIVEAAKEAKEAQQKADRRMMIMP